MAALEPWPPCFAQSCPGLVNHYWPFWSALPAFTGIFVFPLECQGIAAQPVLSSACWSCLGELAQAQPYPGHCSVPSCGRAGWQRHTLWNTQHSLEPKWGAWSPDQSTACPLSAAEQRHSPLGASRLHPLVCVCAGGATQGLAPAPRPSERDISFVHLSQNGTQLPPASASLQELGSRLCCYSWDALGSCPLLAQLCAWPGALWSHRYS